MSLKLAVTYIGIFPPLKGFSGGDRRARDIVRGLANPNNEVYMLVPNYRNPQKENLDTDFKILYLGSNRFKNTPLLNRLFYWQQVVKFSKKNALNALMFYGPSFESYIPARLIKSTNTKVIMEMCDMQSSNTKSLLKRMYEKLGERWMPRVTDFNVVISKFLFDFVHATAPKIPIETIPILADTDMFQPNASKREVYRQKYSISEEQVVITYVGGMWKEEGVDNLIYAFAQLVSSYGQKVKLLIAGKITKDPSCTDVEGLIEQLNISNSVILAGWVDTDTVISILNASDILTVPQGNVTFNKAGLPTKLAEYSSMGKAIVATKMGDVPVYFKHEDNALLCMPSDTKSLFESLERLIKEPELRIKIGQNARNTAKNIFDYRINGAKIIQFIKGITK
jgi:glycosyltransferase involved in cell wall biosynthesis